MALRVYIVYQLVLTLPLCLGNSVANDLAISSSAIEDFASALGEKRVEFTQAESMIGKQRRMVDWDSQNKIPPWMSHISPGSKKAVGVLLGQSLQPDGSPPPVLLARVKKAKRLLDEGNISKVIVSGSDAAGVGHTEAFEMFKLLVAAGVPADKIIQEPQALTTAENAWFALRWIPQSTGQLHIITSEFHIPRATYIFNEVFNFFYAMAEARYANDTAWKSDSRKYPRLEIHEQVAESFCGSNASTNKDDDPKADINLQSLAKRAMDELGFLGSKGVADGLYGPPSWIGNQVWPMQIDVQKDPENEKIYAVALAQAENNVVNLCECKSRPDPEATPALDYPVRIPIPRKFLGPGSPAWQDINAKCRSHDATTLV